jgi:hypothetical protein
MPNWTNHGTPRGNFQAVVDQRDRAHARIRELETQLADAEARARRSESAGPGVSEDASLGEYLRLRYAGRFGSGESFRRAADDGLMGTPMLKAQTPYRMAGMPGLDHA